VFSNTPARARFGHLSLVAIPLITNETHYGSLEFELASRVISAAFRQATAVWVKQRFPMM
jgi:hypothetical protein